MIVVSDSTTLIILSDLKKLEYLSNLFDTILLPMAVFEEINHQKTLNLPKSFKKVRIKQDAQFDVLCELLDRGESEAITLSLQKNLPLIIDEKKGRKIAKNLGINILGLLGVLYLNIKKEFISKYEAKAFLNDALHNGYRVSQTLIDEMLASV